MADKQLEFAVCCGTCPYFVIQQGDMGLCHEGPGQVIAMPTDTARGAFNTHTVLPPKRNTDWCGHHPMFMPQHSLVQAVPIDRRLAAEPEGTG